MTLIELLNELNQKNIQISFSNGKIKYSGPQENVTPEILKKIKDHKAELIKHLWSSEKYNLIPISLTGEAIPLILVHGGNSANFLPEFLKGQRPLLNYLDLGSEGEKITIKTVDELARYYISQLKMILPNGPYILCGFSFGGFLANLMAKILQDEYKDHIPCIIMFDTQTPTAKRPTRVNKVINMKNENKFVFLFNALIKRIKKLDKTYHLYPLFNKPLPTKHRKKYILDVYTKISKDAQAVKVNTDLLLFISNDNEYIDPNLGWNDYFNHIEPVYLDGDHLKILYNKENYTIISNKIVSFLEQYQLTQV